MKHALTLLFVLTGCWSMSDPHDVNLFAASDARAALRGGEPCDHPLEVLSNSSAIRRPYRQVASLSTNCSPGVPQLCRQRLRQRACALGADALVYERNRGGVSYTGAEYNDISLDGRAIRWVD